ncbi:hypothetical protein Pcinc_014506 [Petrolisthes cinctipes]|uniref:C2H2-type domain-containing protein n=1 Tax=Petrolisthes cinctipes TaxID=88211 RepID=A0AAE1KQN2_PETCI|nr:hypothetical protein Pcinc_014506 [Petrolisthes cinctipes]
MCRAGSFTSCQTCGQRFHGVYQKYNLKRHMSIHTGERPYPCPSCPAAFNQKCNMKRHLESVHGMKAGTGPQDSPQIHLELSQGTKPSLLAMCTQEMHNVSTAHCHTMATTNSQVASRNPRPRPHSHLSTSEVAIARTLLTIPDQSTPFSSAISSLNTSHSMSKISIQSSSSSSSTPTSTPNTSGSSLSVSMLKFSSCPECGKIFRGDYHKYNLKKHLTIHAGLRPYTCPICNMSFNQKGQGEVTFPGSQSDTVCPLCGQNFIGINRKNNLKQHLAIHSGLRPFQCYMCPQTFVRKSHLKRHLGTLHKEKLTQ